MAEEDEIDDDDGDDDDLRMSMKPLLDDSSEKIVTLPGRQEVVAHINDKLCVTAACLKANIHPAIRINTLYPTSPLQNIIIIYDMILRQKQVFKHQ